VERVAGTNEEQSWVHRDRRLWSPESERHHGFAREARLLFGIRCECGFELVCLKVDSTAGDFFFAGSMEAELADAEAVFCRQRGTEGAAGERTGCVEVAESRGGVECSARLVVCKVFKGVGAVGVEDAGAGVAWE
jgi:hypothetical protein